jgi:hypothetical protein
LLAEKARTAAYQCALIEGAMRVVLLEAPGAVVKDPPASRQQRVLDGDRGTGLSA